MPSISAVSKEDLLWGHTAYVNFKTVIKLTILKLILIANDYSSF